MSGKMSLSIALASAAFAATSAPAQQQQQQPAGVAARQQPATMPPGMAPSTAMAPSTPIAPSIPVAPGGAPRLPAAPDPANLRVTNLVAHQLRGGAYWLEGGRSNAGFVVGTSGVVVIDTGNSPDDGHKEIAKVAEVTPRAVNQVIVTHADPDHVGGLPAFPAGTPVMAQENARSIIESSATAAAADPKLARYVGIYAPIVAGYLPMPTIAMTQTVTLDGVRMVLIHVAPAHTSGDLVVYLPKERVVYGGDIVLTNTGRFPIIHYGGSSLGWIETMKAILALDADIYVPGHGPIVPKAQLEASLKDVEQYRARIKAMVEQKKTLAEVMQALPEPGASPMFLSFTQTVYKELTEGYPPASAPWTNLIIRR